MQGTIAQIVSLVVEGNAALRKIPTNGIGEGHTAMTFCEYVRFVDLAKTPNGWSERSVADTPIAWFKYLLDRKVTELRMVYGPSNDPNVDGVSVTDRMLVGFVGGGGRWLIQANKKDGCDLWEARWSVGDQSRKDQRIWQVTYGRIARNRAISPQQEPDLAAVRAEFERVLTDIGKFAKEQELTGFADCFEKALRDLVSESGFSGYHKELADPRLLPLAAIQLLSAAQSSWVFGGMGSWNDLGFSNADQDRYERLSEDLYRVINQAIVVATNASVAGPSNLSSPATVSEKAKDRPWWKIFG